MSILRRDARRHEPYSLAACVEEDVDAFCAGAVTAFDQHRFSAERQKLLRLRSHLGLVARRFGAKEGRGLGKIGGQNAHARDQVAQPAERLAAQQELTGACDHHRIEHHRARVVAIERGRDHLDRRRPAEHADLHRADRKIAEDSIDLRGDEIRRHVVNSEHAFCVLRGQRGSDGRAIDAKRRKRFQIRGDAGAAARVETRDAERRGQLMRRPALPSVERAQGA